MRQLHGLVDVDGVLADFPTAFFREVRGVTGRQIDVADVKAWDFARAIGLTAEEESRVHERIMRPGWGRTLAPYPDAAFGVAVLRSLGTVHALTSPWTGHPTWHGDREEWLRVHTGIAPHDVTHSRQKHRFAGDYLVDDKSEHVVDWATAHRGGLAILWGQPYNRGDNLFAGAVRASSWEEVASLLRRRFGEVCQ